MTDHSDLVRIDRPTLRADATLKLEASGYVASDLLDRLTGGPAETLEVEGTFETDDFEPFDFDELDRWTIDAEAGKTINWFWHPGGGDSAAFVGGRTYALIEILTERPEDDDE